ncbi:hypothetical protein FA10DRAFT_264306 [Acaromyces ingoldii]|uniref:Uncharacterized protein n=1 Tax=Acaromyces ingoldii TaxID=215250 RepID=A0A316YX58_9BASI|nr:hypothetical protein FA10DRAFT_264306 [Acaromyces ingoldii]PWN93692.1 hypothetical protein FA10DRAFT_264306 [Acaromyces ingoldii]
MSGTTTAASTSVLDDVARLSSRRKCKARTNRTRRFGIKPSLLVTTLAAWGAQAAPVVVTMAGRKEEHLLLPRKPVLSNSDMKTIDGTPLDAIILIVVALGFAFMCMCYTLVNAFWSRAGGRIVLEERARAKTELRLRGATRRAGSTSPPDTPHPTNADGTRRSRTEMSIVSSASSNTKLLSGAQRPAISSYNRTSSYGPKIDSSRRSRSSRTYSAANARPDAQPSMSSMLAIPQLPGSTNYNPSTGSLSSGTSSGNSNGNGQRRPRGPRADSDRVNRSSTVGRGIDLSRNRSLKERAAPPHVNPRAVDPTYASPITSYNAALAPESTSTHPLFSPNELRRYVTEPSSPQQMRRDSVLSTPEPWMADAKSSSSGHGSGSPTVQQPNVASRPQHDRHNSRGRPIAMYDFESDDYDATAASGLISSGYYDQQHSNGQSPALPPKAGWSKYWAS